MKVFYEKVGRRYKPVYQHDDSLMSAMPKGAHLVVVQPGLKTVKFNVSPSYASVVAAIMLHRSELVDILRNASEARPSSRPLSKREQKALAAWYAVAGKDSLMTLEIPSAHDVLDALSDAMVKELTGEKP